MTTLATTPGDGGSSALSVEKDRSARERLQRGRPRHLAAGEQLFVSSWKYLGSNGAWFARVRKYHPTGPLGGGHQRHPDDRNLYDHRTARMTLMSGCRGRTSASPTNRTNNWPYLDDRGQRGFQVGPFVSLKPSGVDNWVSCAGTTTGS